NGSASKRAWQGSSGDPGWGMDKMAAVPNNNSSKDAPAEPPNRTSCRPRPATNTSLPCHPPHRTTPGLESSEALLEMKIPCAGTSLDGAPWGNEAVIYATRLQSLNTAFTTRPNIRSRPAATQEAQPVNVIDCGCIPIWCSSDDRLSWAGHRDTASEEGPVWAAICSRGPLGEYRSITTRTTQHIYVLLPLPNLSTSMWTNAACMESAVLQLFNDGHADGLAAAVHQTEALEEMYAKPQLNPRNLAVGAVRSTMATHSQRGPNVPTEFSEEPVSVAADSSALQTAPNFREMQKEAKTVSRPAIQRVRTSPIVPLLRSSLSELHSARSGLLIVPSVADERQPVEQVVPEPRSQQGLQTADRESDHVISFRAEGHSTHRLSLEGPH
ncbi:hypothetical protein KUCAC02_008646, partial [Chaenocephalus aceratus]